MGWPESVIHLWSQTAMHNTKAATAFPCSSINDPKIDQPLPFRKICLSTMTWAQLPINQWDQLKIHLRGEASCGRQAAIRGWMKVRANVARPSTGWGLDMMNMKLYGHRPRSRNTMTTPAIVPAHTVNINNLQFPFLTADEPFLIYSVN